MDHSMVPVRSMAVAHSTQVQVRNMLELGRNMALAAGSTARSRTTSA
ncbi:MAG: hypothetical protein WKF77_28775 [Planctomycetaceae bacterium]